MSKERILVIEDEENLLEMIRLRLASHGFDVLTAENGKRGLALALETKPDLVVLDLMLPELGGLDVLKAIREDRDTCRTPILIVSALGEENDVVVGLELGADDYLSKPFSMTVLVARVNALLRRLRVGENETGDMTIGEIRMDTERYQVFVNERPIHLTTTEYRLLLALVSSRGRVLTRNQLIDRAIGHNVIVNDRTIDVHLASLRSKLGDCRKMIETVRGVGYRIASGNGS